MANLKTTLRDLKRAAAQAAYLEHGTYEKACKALGISRKSLYHYLNKREGAA